MESFSTIRSAKISRSSLWILGEYCEKPTDIQAVMNEIRQSLGEIPIVEDELRKVMFSFLIFSKIFLYIYVLRKFKYFTYRKACENVPQNAQIVKNLISLSWLLVSLSMVTGPRVKCE